MLEKLSRFFASIAPGIFIIGYVIGTGSVTTMAAAGAKYGMSLTWTSVLASVFTGIMLVAISKTSIVTGQTALYLFRKHFGAPITIFFIVGLMCTQISSIVGVMAIVADVIREWSRPLTADGLGFPTLATAVIITAILYGLFFFGRHDSFLKALAFLVGLMGLSFLITMIMVAPDLEDILMGLIPRVPSEGNPHLLVAGMVGTTMATVVLITRSTLVRERKWTTNDFREEHRDAIISVTLLLIINLAIMGSAAGTMFVQGIEVTRAIDMVNALEPLAGRLAVTIFVLGIVSAGMSSLFPNYLLGVWLLTDYLDIPRDVHRPSFRLLVLGCALMGLFVPIFGGSPVPIMIASQAVSPILMPLFILLITLLLNKPELMGKHRNKWPMNAALGVTLLFSLFMLYTSVLGFLDLAA
jgi:Mn2+/Fe2+ NRAMP family transporter